MAGTGNQEAINGDVQHLLQVSKQYLGVPYVWGGKTPNGWDCSGFVGWVYKEAWGIDVSTWTVTQALVGDRIPVSEAQAWRPVVLGSYRWRNACCDLFRRRYVYSCTAAR